MSRPQSQAEYLASLLPPSVAGTQFGRRALFRGALGVAAAGSLAACGGDSGDSATDTKSATGTVTFGSNQSDAVPKAAYAKVTDQFHTANPKLTVKTNTVDHNTFQEQITSYLQGSPDDVFTWFSGFRMRFFAAKGLAGDISDIWPEMKGFSDALKTASTGDDGKQYFVPFTNYPWAIFYRKSVFADKGYQIPKTLDDLTALSKQMQKDGLSPIAFGDKDGWPAMGTFDQLNMRINGFQFHVDLMAGKKPWNGPEVKKVFDTWAGLLPYHQDASLGRTWQEAAQSLQQKKSGMYVLGMFVGQQFPKGAEQDDLDFFPFPEIDPAIGADAIEAPIDGFMMSKRPKNEAGAKAFLKYLGTPEAEGVSVAADPTVIAVNSGADTSAYSALQKKAVEFVGNAKNISQFLDRDTRPDFASNVMIPAIQTFIKNPKDIDGLVNSIEKQKQSIFATDG
ncbi:ABC transporter substrate-binding protein [Angustibacter sp. McL0619]|uniref:ABC transporter substrate-binding protein n=1 Tax=Angustibacter sp. McL0619 TaxID=3415676 RepID=UPI003CF34765